MISPVYSILVVSDSHGNIPALTAALSWACEAQAANNIAFNAAIFLGDGASDLAPASSRADFSVPWHKVRGIGDLNFSIPASQVLEIPAPQDPREGQDYSPRKLFLAHGHQYALSEGYQLIAAAAKAAGAEAALFGHTHAPHCSTHNGTFLLNPGSIGRSRSDAGPTFAVLSCPATGPLTARIFRLLNKSGKMYVEDANLF